MSFGRIDRRRAFEAIVEQIREAILTGRYAPASRLPTERELGLQFGVGRHAVREAIRVLEHAGLVTVRRGRGGGTFIDDPGAAPRPGLLDALTSIRGVFVDHVFGAKLLFEPIVAEQAARRAQAPHLSDLAAALESEARALREPRDAYPEFVRFHVALAEPLDNPLVSEIVGALDAATRLLHLAAGPRRAVFVGAHREHEHIYEAIRKRRPAQARTAMAEHLEAMAARYLRAVPAMGRLSAAAIPPRGRQAG